MQVFTPSHHDPLPALQAVEVSSSFQIPSLQIVGLASQEVGEARERVRSAIEASEKEFPRRRLVVNLSPAHIRKKGTGADLAIALAILLHAEPPSDEEKLCAVGELGLSGEIKGIGQMTRAVCACLDADVRRLIVADEDFEAALEARELIARTGKSVDFLRVFRASTLAEAWAIVSKNGNRSQSRRAGAILRLPRPRRPRPEPLSIPEIRIPPSLGRSLLVSASGAHHLLFLGPKGTGKSTAGDLLIHLLPDPSPSELLEGLLIRELTAASGQRSPDDRPPVVRVPPSIRPAGLIGRYLRDLYQPGAFCLADRGLLIADELAEWPRDSREALREPLERRSVTIHRQRGPLESPARFILVATANLCPCGNYSPTRSKLTCRCSPRERDRYLSHLSGPVLDRIDLVSLIDVPSDSTQKNWPLLREFRDQALFTRSFLQSRLGLLPGELEPRKIEEVAGSVASSYPGYFDLVSLRGRHKLMRVALTLAALEGKTEIEEHHLFEASLFRPERWAPTSNA